ncbi:polysaccharide biosynthesis protein [Rhodovulum sp. P5]|nr:polysaccharide biosynthesis protein [Rhodovulum sp. P5]
MRRIAAVLVGRSMARVAQFVAFLLLGRMLDPSDFGWYGILTASIVLAAQIGSIGLRQAAAVWLGQGKDTPGQVVANLLTLWPVLSALSVVGVLLVAPPVGAVGLAFVIPVAMLGAMAVILMQGVLLGLGRTTAFGLTDSLMPMLLLVAVAGFALTGQASLGAVLVALAGSYLLAGGVAIVMGLRWGGLARPEPSRIVPMVRHGFAFAVNVFLILLSTRISLFLVEGLASAEAAGQFFVGQRLSDVLGEVAMAAGFVLFSDTVRAEDRAAAMRANARIAAFVLWGFTGLSIVVMLLAAPLVALTFGETYAPAVPVLQITALAIGPAAATKLIYPTLTAQGRPLIATPVILVGIAVNVALSLVLIPGFGLTGAAIALVASQVALLAGYGVVLKRRFEIPYRTSLIPSLRGDGP